MKVELDIISKQECSERFDDDDNLEHGIIDSQICATDLLEGKMDTCSGGEFRKQADGLELVS